MPSRYLLRRLAQVLPTVAGLLVVNFCIVHLAPGDPVIALGGEHGDAAYYAFIRARFGLDRPLPEQLLTYVTNVLRGRPRNVVRPRAPRGRRDRGPAPGHAALVSVALALSSLAGVALGILAARRGRRPADLLLQCVALLGYAAPSFWLAQIAMLTLAMGTGSFPCRG